MNCGDVEFCLEPEKTIQPLFVGELRGCNGVNLSAIEPLETLTCSALGTSQVSKQPIGRAEWTKKWLISA